MENTVNRGNLVNALQNPTEEMGQKLDSLREIGKELSEREDVVW